MILSEATARSIGEQKPPVLKPAFIMFSPLSSDHMAEVPYSCSGYGGFNHNQTLYTNPVKTDDKPL